MPKLIVSVRYGTTPNSILYAKELSFKAKGLWGYIQSKPEGWKFSSKRIILETKDGIDSIQAGLKELEDAGLLVRTKEQNVNGFWDWDYILYEKPVQENPVQDEPVLENPVINKTVFNKTDLVKSNNYADESADPIDDLVIQPEMPESQIQKVTYRVSKFGIRTARIPHQKKPKFKIDPNTPQSLEQFVALCKKTKDKIMMIIGEWAEGEQPNNKTVGEWDAFKKRNLRAAKDLEVFSIERIEKAYQLMQNDLVRKLPNGKQVGFLTKYSLETIGKYIDQV